MKALGILDVGSGVKVEHCHPEKASSKNVILKDCHPETGVVCPFSGSMYLGPRTDAVEDYTDPEACKRRSPQDDSFPAVCAVRPPSRRAETDASRTIPGSNPSTPDPPTQSTQSSGCAASS
jgi:hypothetical protein